MNTADCAANCKQCKRISCQFEKREYKRRNPGESSGDPLEDLKAYQREYRQNNKEKISEYCRKRYAKIKAEEPERYKRMLERQTENYKSTSLKNK